MYDAIVVGARCAGSPTAMLLARKGYRVLLLDKAGFPSDTLSTHYIQQVGVARLKRWGLVDMLALSNCPPLRQWRFDLGPFALVGTPPPVDGVQDAFAPRRTVLDEILVEAAVGAGAELRQYFSVQELVWEGGRVTGIRGRESGGPVVTENARIVIGADGMRSQVARSVEAPTYNARPSLSCTYYSYWSAVSVESIELYAGADCMVFAFPTNDGQTITVVYVPNSTFQQFRTAVEENFLKTLELAPSLAERVRHGKRSERFYGTADLPNFYRRPYGPGWALVGDAGYYRDPITAQGISDAFRDAELLAQAIDDGLRGRRMLENALQGYEQERNEATLPMYDMTFQQARLKPLSPKMQQLYAALRHSQADADRFFGTLAGSVPLAEFYAPENISRILRTVPQGTAA